MEKETGRRGRVRRYAGDFYVQLAAAYLVVAVATYIRAFPLRSQYMGKIWLTPLHVYYDPRVTWWLLPAATVLTLGTFLVLWGVRTRRNWGTAAGAFLNVVGVGMAPGGGRMFPMAWLEGFLADARMIFNAGTAFARYAFRPEDLNLHARVRPAFVFWLIHGLDVVFKGNLYVMEAVLIIFAALCVVPLFRMSRPMGEEEGGRWAAALLACAPALLIFGSGADGLYCLIALVVLWLTAKAATANRFALWAAGAGLALALALVSSYVLVVLAAVAVAFLAARALVARAGARPVAAAVVIIAAAAAALAVFQLATGYDHVATFKRAYVTAQRLSAGGDNVVKFVGRALGLGGAAARKPAERSYLIFTVGNVYAILFIMGIPAAVLYLRAMFRIFAERAWRRSFYGAAALAYAAVFLAYNFTGLVLGEVERVWLFLIPPLLIPAGVELARLARAPGGRRLVAVVFGLTVAQAFAFNVLCYQYFLITNTVSPGK